MGEHQAQEGRDRREARQDLHAPHQRDHGRRADGRRRRVDESAAALAIDKATDQNMPKDTIERAVKRGSGGLEGANYEEIRYEGYGINGAAVIVDCMTDNRTRTGRRRPARVLEIRRQSRHRRIGRFPVQALRQIVFAPGTSEDRVMEAAIEAGPKTSSPRRTGVSKWSPVPTTSSPVKDALAKAGLKPEFAEVTMKPATEVEMSGEDAARMQKLLDAIESLDDVQNVHTNAVLDA
jgi:transcriptional/translational regulatory protein YebC/TACO1